MSEKQVKFLDLDALATKEIIRIKLNGKDHEMKQMTVEDFVWATKEAEIRDGDETDPSKMINMMIEVLGRQFPTIEDQEFRSMGFDKLAALLDFTRKIASEGSEEVVAEAAAEGKVVMTEETPQQ